MKKLIAVAALSLVAATPPQQQPQMPVMGETIEVSIVNVDVVVTDKQGNRVRGLTKDDFEILENGRKQVLSNFAAYSAAQDPKLSVETPVAAGRPAPPPDEPRTIVLFVERFHLPQHRVDAFTGAIKELLAKVVRPGDAVSIVTWDDRVDIALEYTDDLPKANAALDAIARKSMGAFADKRALAEDEVEVVRRMEEEAARVAAAAAFTVGATRSDDKSAEGAIFLRAQQELLAMKRRVNAVNAVIHTMAGARGKKVLLLAAHRLSEFAGGEFAFGSMDNLTGSFRQQFDCRPIIQTIVDNANASGVTIYPIYPTGMPAGDMFPDAARFSGVYGTDSYQVNRQSTRVMGQARSLQNETVMLEDVAKKTGGLAAWDTTAIVKLLPDIADDVHEYYSLAYRVESKRADRARDVVVKTRNKDYVVRARQQFIERSDESQMKDRVVAMLFHAIEQPQFELSADVGSRNPEMKRQMVPLQIRIPIKDLTILPQGGTHAGSFAVFVASRGERGAVSEVTRRSQRFQIPDGDLERAKTSYFTYEFELQVDESTDRVAIGVYDEVGRTHSLLAKDLR